MALDIGVFLDTIKNLFKSKVSSNDTQPDYLINKFTSSDASVTITETNDGGIEQINLQSAGGGGSSIYTDDDSFTGNRTATMSGYDLTFTGSTQDISITSEGYFNSFGSSGTTKNLVLGELAGGSAATAASVENVCLGVESGEAITSGRRNVFIGYAAGEALTTNEQNVAVGAYALRTSNRTRITAVGYGALINHSSGDENVAFGYAAGWFHTGGGNLTSTSNSTFLGYQTRGTTGATNEIMVGHTTDGNGSNTATWGNTSITEHYFAGDVAIGDGTTAPNASAKLDISSTTGGVLMPRMTAAQAGAITGVDGLVIYVNSTDATFTSVGFWGYQGGAWAKL